MAGSPMEWLKLAYEIVGAKYPTGSLVAITLLGALLGAVLFGGGWRLLAHQYNKDHESKQPPAVITPQTPQTTGPATTSGPNSPAVTGSGNNIYYGEKSAETKPKKQ